MIQSLSPFALRRQSLGLSLGELQSRLAAHGFHYSMDMLRAMEQGERGFPVHNPGFLLALSHSLQIPVTDTRRAAHHNAFQQKVHGLRPQNRVLLQFVLRYPLLTELPGFDLWFAIIQSLVLRLPDHWFDRRS